MKIVFLRIGSFSGVNQGILKEIKKLHDVVAEIDPHVIIDPRSLKLKAIYNFTINFFNTFFRYGRNWKIHYNSTPFAFKAMTKYCEKRLKELDYDIILQTQTLFSASFKKPDKPYFIYTDYTHKYSELLCLTWARGRNKRQLTAWSKLENEALHNADKIFTYNGSVKDSLIEKHNIDKNKIKVTGVGVNFDELPNIKKNYENKEILMVTSEGSVYLQGLGCALDAFKILREKIPDIKLNIVGYKLKQDPEGVTSYDFMPREKFIDLYEKASIFIIPGVVGGPQATLEAMSKKCICIGSEHNALLFDMILDGKTGFKIHVNDTESLAIRIKRIIEDKKLMKKIGEAAYKNVIKNFTWKEVAKKMNSEIRKFKNE